MKIIITDRLRRLLRLGGRANSRCLLSLLVLLILLPGVLPLAEAYTEAPPAGKISGKDCPIVLVHGFTGWGRKEMGGFLYWGGKTLDIEKHLANKGFKVVTASVGPVSSVHDRACELFWQLRGGRVDYGADHAEKYGHKRFGREFSALLPEWSEARPVHMIGHSMGGQTIRYLTELLARDFFKQGTSERWVLSVSTISTPHNGTTLAAKDNTLFMAFIEKVLTNLIFVTRGSLKSFYDFDLDQWGLEQKKEESATDFIARIDSVLWGSRDISTWDVSPQGARELNEQIRVFPDIYYMSYANAKTQKPWFSQIHVPSLKISPIMIVPAWLMGTYRGRAVSAEQLHLWFQNDGIVNTVSMGGPNNSKIVKHSAGPISKGVWTSIGKTSEKDHLMMVGHFVSKAWVTRFYNKIASRLAALDR